MIETKDIYWLAGLLEGEGCFSDAGPKHRYRPVITLKMNDADVIARAHSLLKAIRFRQNGNSPIKRNDRTRIGAGSAYWVTKLSGRRAAGWMMTLYPLMGERRQARIRAVLEVWRAAPRRKLAA